jgi:hypothetical protein
VALLAQSMARVDVEQGRLVRLLSDWEPEPVELHAVYPSRLNSSPKVRVFLEFLREHLGAIDGEWERSPLVSTKNDQTRPRDEHGARVATISF